MKKLMVMMGAVATALGLFADTPSNYYSTSFEADDDGCSSGSKFDWSAVGWSYAKGEDNLALGEQQDAGLPYAEGRARRNDFFKNGSVNSKYLKLETGTNTLSHAIETGQVYIDQLVKFTGYEEAPTEFAEGTKIAVWMSAIEADDTVDPVVNGKTNLYVAVGTGTGIKNVKLDCSVETETWYRLTVKSLGNINTSEAYGDRLGFKIFINGVPATIVADDRGFSEQYEQFETGARALYNNGQLFTSMTSSKMDGEIGATAASLSSVGYKGIGALDDLIISQEAPEFDSATDVQITPPANTTIILVKDSAGNTIGAVNGKYTIAAGRTMTVTLQAAAGYFFPGGATTLDISGIDPSAQVTIPLTQGQEPVTAQAKVGDTNPVYYYTLQDAIDATNDVTIVLQKDIAITSTITVSGKTLDFNLGGNTITATTGANVWAMTLNNGTVSTISNGAIESTTGRGICVDTRANVTIDEDVELVAATRGISAYDGVTLTMNGSVEVKGGEGIFWWNDDKERQTTVTIGGSVTATGNAAAMGSGNDNDAFGCNVTITGSITSYDNDGVYFPNAGTLTIDGEYAEVSGATFGIYAKSGTLTINGGTIASTAKTYEAPTAYNNGTRGAGVAVVLETGSEKGGYANNLSFSIKGGTFTSVGPAVYNLIREGADPIVGGIEGGDFSWKAEISTALILAKQDMTGTWIDSQTVQNYKTVAWEKLPVQVNLTITAENATVTGIENGTVLEGSNLTFTVAANTGYNLVDVKANGETLTAGAQGTYTYTVTGKETDGALVIVVTVEAQAPAVDPTVPGEFKPIQCADQDAADAKVGEINAAKANYIKAPTGVTDTDAYLALFEAKTVVNEGQYSVVVDLTETAKADLQEQVNNEAAAAISNISAANATIATTPGLYYSIIGDTDVAGQYATAGTEQMATSATTELAKPNLGTTTKAFYKVKVSVTPAQ